MRPVNLIPPEDRRGEKAPLRTGPLAYVIVGVLAAALVGVTLTVMTGNKVAERKAEVTDLETQVTAAQAQAEQLNSYADFAALQEARQETVTSLATSRFDWERVLRELAIVIPGDVWLTNLTATASPDSSSTSASSSSTAPTDGVLGPSLDIQGCASGHESVAKFLAALRDVDGVTRVTVMSSDRPGADTSSDPNASATGSTDGGISCASYDFISTFEVVAAFDAAPPTAPTSGVPSSTTDSTSATLAAGQSSVAEGQAPGKQSSDADADKTQKGTPTASAFIPGTGSAP